MKSELKHLGGMAFEASHRQHRYLLDTATLGGTDRGASPKELLLSSVLGCTGMDVAALLKKYKIATDTFELEANADLTEQHPKIFKQIDIVYKITGQNIPIEKAREAVELSMTKFCGVSAMVSKASPIFYTIVINGEIQHRGQARFP